MTLEQSYQKTLEWIHGLGRFGIKPGLERITALLEMLDNPHNKVRFIHIGGTNGKGSTAIMLASVLRAAGYNIGLYTSPYLLSFTNRMAVNGFDIDKRDLVELVDRVRPLIEKIGCDQNLGEMTEFEVVTALALTYFAEQKVDLVVLEVGLGGRLDATNVVVPLLSVITNISLEHTVVLGDTVEAIAVEKAGIIKPERPLITAAEDQRALTVFQTRCYKLSAPLYRVFPSQISTGEQPTEKPVVVLEEVTEDGQFFSYRGYSQDYKNLFIPLRGLYQLNNVATALAALEILTEEGFQVAEKDLRSGLAELNWPGRMELLNKQPLLIMDGAHNPAAIEKLTEAIPLYFKYKRLILIIGILADKDIAAILEHILVLADIIIFTRPVFSRAADPREVADFAVSHYKLGKKCLVIQEYGEALDQALAMADPGDAVLVTGSLYTVSDIRTYWLQRQDEIDR